MLNVDRALGDEGLPAGCCSRCTTSSSSRWPTASRGATVWSAEMGHAVELGGPAGRLGRRRPHLARGRPLIGERPAITERTTRLRVSRAVVRMQPCADRQGTDCWRPLIASVREAYSPDGAQGATGPRTGHSPPERRYAGAIHLFRPDARTPGPERRRPRAHCPVAPLHPRPSRIGLPHPPARWALPDRPDLERLRNRPRAAPSSRGG